MTTRVPFDRAGAKDQNGATNYNFSRRGLVVHVYGADEPKRLYIQDFRRFGRGQFVINEELHEWLLNQDLTYDRNVALGFVPDISQGEMPGTFVMDFVNARLATLFKLTWGGNV